VFFLIFTFIRTAGKGRFGCSAKTSGVLNLSDQEEKIKKKKKNQNPTQTL
jgi:hypothetical protein